MKKRMTIPKRIIGTLIIPVIVFIIMWLLCLSQGKTSFGTWSMWRSIIPNIAISVTCAMGIGLQFKCGRFDFSGGSIMLVSSIIAGRVAVATGNNLFVMMGLCLLLCILLSVIVGVFYIYSKVSIVIVTIGFAMLYEAVSCMIYKGEGITLVSNMTLRVFSTFPMALIPLVACIIIYAIYSYLTVTGRRANLLSLNQKAAVNIGIKEAKNVILSFIFSGAIFGFASMIYVGNAIHKGAFSSMSTVGELFTNILPVFIGLIVVEYCGDTIGIIVGSISLCLLSYGLSSAFTSELGQTLSVIVTAAFILLVNAVPVQVKKIQQKIQNRKEANA